MSWFRPRPGLTTPTGSPAWLSNPPALSQDHAPALPSVAERQQDRLAALCAFASGLTAVLSIAINWRELHAYPAAFYFLAYTYRFVSPFLWAGTIGLGFGSRSRLIRTLASCTAGFVGMAYLWPRFGGGQIPFAPARLFYGSIMVLGAFLWWRKRK